MAARDALGDAAALLIANPLPPEKQLDPALHDREDLGCQPVGRWNDGPDVEERYVVAPSGAVEVTLTTRPAGFERTFRLERHPAGRT